MPRTSCGPPMAFGCSRWTTAGAGSSPPSSIGTPSVSAGMSASAAIAALQPIHGACRAVSTAAGAARGLARMDQAPSMSDHFTNQIKWGCRPTPLSPVTNVADLLKEPIIHGRIGVRDAVLRLRRTLQCPVDRRKERLPEPEAQRSQSGPPRETNLCRNRVRYTPKSFRLGGFESRSDRLGPVVSLGYYWRCWPLHPVKRHQTRSRGRACRCGGDHTNRRVIPTVIDRPFAHAADLPWPVDEVVRLGSTARPSS